MVTSAVVTRQPHELTTAHSIASFKHVLPRWIWEPQIDLFSWKPKVDLDAHHQSRATVSDVDWFLALQFYNSLMWEECDDAKTAFMELTFEFHSRGFKFTHVNHNPAAISTFLRKVHSLYVKRIGVGLTPGSVKAVCKSEGRTLPSGCVCGGRALLSLDALKNLAAHSFRKTHSLDQWRQPF